MQPVARHRLHQKAHECLRVPGHHFAERAAVRHLPLEHIEAEGVRAMTGGLDNNIAAGDRLPQHGRDADHALVANHRHLDAGAVVHRADDRTQAFVRKIHVGEAIATLVENLARSQRPVLEVGKKALVIGRVE
jgi:hypothetical protein